MSPPVPWKKMSRPRRRLVLSAGLLLLLLLYCELLHYFVVLLQCTWPRLQTVGLGPEPQDLKVMFLADTHILGFRDGHWFDKLRREWQMKRGFQTSMLLHHPDVVFVLGDLLDEGKWCDDEEFAYHVQRFNSMFAVPPRTQRHLVVGNHDVGFHYMCTEHKQRRFEDAFGSRSAALLRVRGVNFVLLNSIAMEGDGCHLCQETESKLREIAQQLQCAKEHSRLVPSSKVCQSFDSKDLFTYSPPILLQHFPLFRPSDSDCNTEDAAPPEEKSVPFKPRYDCLSEEATDKILRLLEPRLVMDAHTHHGCFQLHGNRVAEWTVASFNWRNKQNPSFIMARISATDHSVSVCHLPDERTVIMIYVGGVVFILLSLCGTFHRAKLGKMS